MKTAKLFANGGSQAVRLPKSFRFEGEMVYIKQWGDGIILLPVKDQEDVWDSFCDSLSQFSDDFMPSRNQPPHQERLELFE